MTQPVVKNKVKSISIIISKTSLGRFLSPNYRRSGRMKAIGRLPSFWSAFASKTTDAGGALHLFPSHDQAKTTLHWQVTGIPWD